MSLIPGLVPCSFYQWGEGESVKIWQIFNGADENYCVYQMRLEFKPINMSIFTYRTYFIATVADLITNQDCSFRSIPHQWPLTYDPWHLEECTEHPGVHQEDTDTSNTPGNAWGLKWFTVLFNYFMEKISSCGKNDYSIFKIRTNHRTLHTELLQ